MFLSVAIKFLLADVTTVISVWMTKLLPESYVCCDIFRHLNASAVLECNYIALFLRLHKQCCVLFQQGGPCELEVTGQNGLVVVNETRIIPGAKVPLRGRDEVMFGRGAKHAYVSLLSNFASYKSVSFVCPFFIYLIADRYFSNCRMSQICQFDLLSCSDP